MHCKGLNVVYVGGFGGIGEKCCEELLENGVQNLVIFDLEANKELLKYFKTTYISSNVYYVPINLMHKESIEVAFKDAMDIMGHLDMVINGGGILNEFLIDETISINLSGLIHSTFIALGYMNKSKGGRGGVIVNISSTSGLEPVSLFSVYTATKSGITSFTRAMADPVYYKQTGVEFITLCPALTTTPILDDYHEKSTMPEVAKLLKKQIENCPIQTPEAFAKIVIEILKEATNGSVWLVEAGKYKRMEFPVMWQIPIV